MTSIRKSTRTTAPTSASRVTKGQVKLTELKTSDRGLKATLDTKTNSLKIAGTARGIETRDPFDPKETDDYLKTEEFGGTIGFDFDMDRMPKFDTSGGY